MCYNSLVNKEGQLKIGNQLGQATRYLSACGVFGLMGVGSTSSALLMLTSGGLARRGALESWASNQRI
jgi:hypothetical protein